MTDVAPEYVIARRVLLDALAAFEDHLDNLILVGAQAVYHHTGDADLNVPLLTTDGDLAINTRDLAEVPEIGSVLRAAGFTPGSNPATGSASATSLSTSWSRRIRRGRRRSRLALPGFLLTRS